MWRSAIFRALGSVKPGRARRPGTWRSPGLCPPGHRSVRRQADGGRPVLGAGAGPGRSFAHHEQSTTITARATMRSSGARLTFQLPPSDGGRQRFGCMARWQASGISAPHVHRLNRRQWTGCPSRTASHQGALSVVEAEEPRDDPDQNTMVSCPQVPRVTGKPPAYSEQSAAAPSGEAGHAGCGCWPTQRLSWTHLTIACCPWARRRSPD